MMHTFFSLSTSLMQTIGWSLLHSLWQGALIYGVLWALHRAFPQASARLKHASSLLALILLCFWIVNTAMLQWQHFSTMPVRIIPGDATASASSIVEAMPASPYMFGMQSDAHPGLQAIMPWIMLCYGIGLLFMLLRFGGGVARLHSLRRIGTKPASSALRQTLHSLQVQLGITQTVLLRISTQVATPLVIGALRPLILIPASLLEELSPEGLEAIVLHELAHIGRADFIINIFQTLVETLLFFNPFVWSISAVIRMEREHCCDDIVLNHTRHPLFYAQALSTVARLGSHDTPAMSLAATGRQPHLLNRIKRIIEMKNQPLRYGQVVAACCIAVLIVSISIVCFTPSAAQYKPKGDEQKVTRDGTPRSGGSKAGMIIIDSNGKRTFYNSIDQLPPKMKAHILQSLRELKDVEPPLLDARDALDAVSLALAPPQSPRPGVAPKAPRVPAVPGTPGSASLAPQAPEVPEPGSSTAPIVRYKIIDRHIDSNMTQLSHVDWDEIEREVAKSIVIVRKNMGDQALEVARHSIDDARKQLAENRKQRNHIIAENRTTAGSAHRELARARAEMERAQRELDRAREQVKQLQRSKSVH